MSDISAANQPGKWRLRWAISKNEIWNILRHPFYLVSMAIPIFVAFTFSLFMGVMREEAESFVIVIYDQGDSALVSGLSEMVGVEWQFVDSETAVLEAVAEDATGGLIIPADFDRVVASSTPPELTAYVNQDARSSNITEFKQELTNHVWQLAYGTPPATIKWQDTNVGLSSFPDFSVDMYMAITFVILGITLTVVGLLSQIIVEARENGIVAMLLSSPVEPGDWLFGISTAICAFTMLISIVLLLIHKSAVEGWWPTLLAVIFLTIILNGLGLFFGLAFNATECKTYTGVASILLIIPVWFLLVSPEQLPSIVRVLLQLIPTYHFGLILIQSLNDTATLSSVAPNVVALFLFGVLFYGLVRWRLKRRPL